MLVRYHFIIDQRAKVICMHVGQIRGQKVKLVEKGKSGRGNQGQPGPACP